MKTEVVLSYEVKVERTYTYELNEEETLKLCEDYDIKLDDFLESPEDYSSEVENFIINNTYIYPVDIWAEDIENIGRATQYLTIKK